MICCFFGHRNAPQEMQDKLVGTIRSLIVEKGVSEFYLGNQGHFDYMALCALRQLSEKYPHITYNVVLAYRPLSAASLRSVHPHETIFPEELATVPPACAISRRNDWMLQRSQIVVVYVTHRISGAASFAEKAARRNKTIINLTEQAPV